jgi:hypothetical protein
MQRTNSAIVFADHPNGRITVPASMLARAIEGTIARSVVDDNDMEDRVAQLKQAAHRGVDDSFFIEDRHDDRHRRLMRALLVAAAILDVLEIAEPEQEDVARDEDHEKGEHERNRDLQRGTLGIGRESRWIEHRRQNSDRCDAKQRNQQVRTR